MRFPLLKILSFNLFLRMKVDKSLLFPHRIIELTEALGIDCQRQFSLPCKNTFITGRISLMLQATIHSVEHVFSPFTSSRKTSKSWLTTGWFTMAIALELCDRVNVYGMVAPDFCSTPSHLSVPYHYYEPSGPDECSLYLSHEHNQSGGHHSFITEKTVFANWAQKYDIHFYQPDWIPSSTLNGRSSHTPATAVS
ncbi:unnamed protein product [Oncorhynchus mykiss]|uniref:Uncharacterized protein n=1 Tax=Oncorhynchus mykiss TaxID=8022 RepID=A0A060WDJ3_ONCMY|nr:unnamed protein product [Oncorhynchus mykiss]